MGREVRYCTSEDGTQIAYCVEGQGPALVICPYFYESFEKDDEGIPQWAELLARLGDGRQVVRHDMRGTGLSRRDAEISFEAQVRDLEAVVKATGLERFNLLGWVVGGAIAIEYAARHPETVNRLVLYSGFTTPTEVMPREALEAFAALCRTNWKLASQTFADMSLREEASEVGLRVSEILRQTLSGEVLATSLEMPYDVSERARTIQAPTLVLHRVDDSAVPFSASQRLASLLPNARLVPLKGRINYPALGDREAIVDAIVSFLDQDRAPAQVEEPAPAEGGLRIILFSDIAGHTAMMQRLGDDRGRELLREHERITRELIKGHGGTEVKALGDGFMASFGSAMRATECAVAMQRAFDERNASSAEPLAVRVGLNAGEPIAEEGDLFGSTVILAARIAAQAAAGEILVPDTVRGLLSGKGFLFADRGDVSLRGFEDPVRLYEVRWRE